ncbi:uncharacterized protein LAESUDRAFT_126586 [Laetiporus sulphureus 93-53]|uniref:Uncharacterized protein n=1 Tax=Laetiporus sulphureus 93-53 TaxID=1314785 RepID=A0A165EG38_9APHY|nr:uncharacterized protein LAESUDRAFT_126586 [Laetiporus sulphureus 93-53]KZT06986.1 hypothetical protein LAESUDRAFT_126586 [Laetiporus sulphureus 93-53]
MITMRIRTKTRLAGRNVGAPAAARSIHSPGPGEIVPIHSFVYRPFRRGPNAPPPCPPNECLDRMHQRCFALGVHELRDFLVACLDPSVIHPSFIRPPCVLSGAGQTLHRSCPPNGSLERTNERTNERMDLARTVARVPGLPVPRFSPACRLHTRARATVCHALVTVSNPTQSRSHTRTAALTQRMPNTLILAPWLRTRRARETRTSESVARCEA